MNKRKTLLLATIFTVFFTVNLFPAETGVQAGQTSINASGAENITDEEMGWPQNYRMEYRSGGIWKYPKFILLGKEYGYKEIAPVFSHSDNETKRLFFEGYELINIAIGHYPATERYKYLNRSNEYFIKAVESYNAFILKPNEQNQNLRNYFKKSYQEKLAQIAEEERLQKTTTLFIGVNTSFGSDFAFRIGLKFGFLFPVYKALKMGFWVEGIYSKYILMNIDFTKNAASFLGGAFQFGLKIDWFYLNAGFFYYRRVSSENIFSTRGGGQKIMLHVGNHVNGIKFSLGYFYEKKIKLYIGLNISIESNTNYQEYSFNGTDYIPDGNPYKRRDVGIEIGIGF